MSDETVNLRGLFDSYRRGGAWEESHRGDKFDAWCRETEAKIEAAIRADERAARVALEAALESIVDIENWGDGREACIEIARAALAASEEGVGQ